eukprot:3983380-Amphidinium_carterae.3
MTRASRMWVCSLASVKLGGAAVALFHSSWMEAGRQRTSFATHCLPSFPRWVNRVALRLSLLVP